MPNSTAILWELLLDDIFPTTENGKLIKEWFTLQRSWPWDGYEGAAQARARHKEKITGVEQRLRELHNAKPGSHGPELRVGASYDQPTGKCICGDLLS